VTAPTSSGKVSGGSIDATAEAGFHMPFGGGFSLTPMGQLVYEHVTLNNTSLGGMDVSFGDSDALIARARLLAQAKWGGANFFASAGASTDVLGAKQTTIAGTDFTSTTGGPQAEFTGGLEGQLSPGFSIFGSGEYDVSFDGQSQSYAGRAGLRTAF
jgi:outer membrane autotransporter protein